MATVLAFPISLSCLVADLATTRQRLSSLRANVIGRDPTDDEEGRWTDLEHREEDLRAKIGTALWEREGVNADVLVAALS